jgi:hypothetical protein
VCTASKARRRRHVFLIITGWGCWGMRARQCAARVRVGLAFCWYSPSQAHSAGARSLLEPDFAVRPARKQKLLDLGAVRRLELHLGPPRCHHHCHKARLLDPAWPSQPLRKAQGSLEGRPGKRAANVCWRRNRTRTPPLPTQRLHPIPTHSLFSDPSLGQLSCTSARTADPAPETMYCRGLSVRLMCCKL